MLRVNEALHIGCDWGGYLQWFAANSGRVSSASIGKLNDNVLWSKQCGTVIEIENVTTAEFITKSLLH